MIIQSTGLCKSYTDTINVLNNISFTIEDAGKIYGFIGPNGAGKTTLLRILSTQLHLTSGVVKVLGFNILNDQKQIRKKISILPQDIQPLFYELTIKEMILYYLRIRGYTKKYIFERMDQILDLFGLIPFKNKKLGSLSGGLSRRCHLSLALSVDADLYFLDEPTVGLDPTSKLFVWSAFQKLVKEGKTLFITSHYMEEISQLCNEVIVLNKGAIVVKGNPTNIVTHEFGDVTSKIIIRSGSVDKIKIMNIVNKYGRHININNELIFSYPKILNTLVNELSSLSIHFEIAPVTLEDVALKLEMGD